MPPPVFRRSRLWAFALAACLPPVVALAAGDGERAGIPESMQSGTVWTVVGTVFAVFGWLMWTTARRQGHADALNRQDNKDRQEGWKSLLEAAERRIEKLETQNAKLVQTLVDQSDTRHINAELQTKLAQMGAAKEEARREALALRRQNDDLLVLLKQSNGGFTPAPAPMPEVSPTALY